MGIKYIDSKRLRNMFIGGANWVKQYENHLNELNVYPVPDGDTGSNMCMTLQTLKTELEEKTTKKSSMEDVKYIIEEAVLMGARGNSGTILSQIITGFLKGIGDKKKLLPKDVAIALKEAKNLAYKSVETPVEGTILTVIRMISEKADVEYSKSEYLDELLKKVTDAANEAVELTPELLSKLKEAGVVDSGGKGLYYLFEGFLKTLTELDLMNAIEKQETEFAQNISDITHDPASIKYRYCTEFIIRNGEFDTDEFKKEVLKLGDSAVFAHSSKKFKIHIHSNTPGLVIELGTKYGDLEKLKIENMKLQNEGLLSSEKDEAKVFINKKQSDNKNAYVTIADTEVLKDEFLKLGADVVILGGQSNNPSVNNIMEALYSIKEDKNIIILPNNKNIVSTANLAAEKSEKSVTVFPTKSMLEGYYFLENKYDLISTIKESIFRNYSIEITKAVRNTTINKLEILENNYIALVNGQIKYTNENIEEMIKQIFDELINDNTLLMTVVEGKEKHSNVMEFFNNNTDKFVDKIKYINAEQDNYDYYIYIENKDPNIADIAIVTDSSSDLDLNEVKGLPIYILPVKVSAEGKEYKEGISIEKEEFWEKLIEKNTVFKTSQPAPKDITNMYKRLFNKGYKKIIAMHISSKLSGTQQVAKLAINSMDRSEDIKLIDTEGASLYQGSMVLGVAKRIVKGANFEEIEKFVEIFKQKSKILIVPTSLEYLERGGRLSKTSRTLADLLNLKPILGLDNGRIVPVTKVFGEANVIRYIEKTINNCTKEGSVYLLSGWGGTAKELNTSNKILSAFKNNNRVKILENKTLGASVGSHAGPIYGIMIFPRLI